MSETNERRTVVVAARLRPSARQRIQAAAAGMGLTLSSYAADRLDEAARRDLERLTGNGGADTEDPGLGAFVRARRPDL